MIRKKIFRPSLADTHPDWLDDPMAAAARSHGTTVAPPTRATVAPVTGHTGGDVIVTIYWANGCASVAMTTRAPWWSRRRPLQSLSVEKMVALYDTARSLIGSPPAPDQGVHLEIQDADGLTKSTLEW